VVEALPPTGAAEVRSALDDLARWTAEACGGTQESALLDAERPAVDLGG
jgi:hypothetical protein